MTIQIKTPDVATSDLKLEAVVIPVADVDRAKQFYEKLGWRLDADFLRPDGSRAVQLTPPGSPASIHLGKGAGLSALSRRQRHRSGARRAHRAWRRGERHLPSRQRPGRPPARSRSGAEELFVACDVQRSRRQSVAAAGSHAAADRKSVV